MCATLQSYDSECMGVFLNDSKAIHSTGDWMLKRKQSNEMLHHAVYGVYTHNSNIHVTYIPNIFARQCGNTV